jgi:hypothetical protein
MNQTTGHVSTGIALPHGAGEPIKRRIMARRRLRRLAWLDGFRGFYKQSSATISIGRRILI